MTPLLLLFLPLLLPTAPSYTLPTSYSTGLSSPSPSSTLIMSCRISDPRLCHTSLSSSSCSFSHLSCTIYHSFLPIYIEFANELYEGLILLMVTGNRTYGCYFNFFLTFIDDMHLQQLMLLFYYCWGGMAGIWGNWLLTLSCFMAVLNSLSSLTDF